jgi:hypothetical protein
MKNLLILFACILTGSFTGFGQQQDNKNNEMKYVIFTSDKKAEGTGEGVYKYAAGAKSDTQISPTIFFDFISKARGISASAGYFRYDLEKLSKIRKVKERDKLSLGEDSVSIESLNSDNLIDMDRLFPKMTKEEFIKVWNSLWDKTVDFIDRAEIKGGKVKLYPVRIFILGPPLIVK